MNHRNIVAGHNAFEARVTELAAAMNLTVYEDSAAVPNGEWYLTLGQTGLSLAQAGKSAASGVQSAFHQSLPAARAANSDLLLKALGFPKSGAFTIVDATAGLGGDAAVIATRAQRLLLVERSPIFAAMLSEGLAQQPGLTGKVQLFEGDAIVLLAELAQRTQHKQQGLDVVYMDPMFHLQSSSTPAARKKKAALPKKSAQSLQAIVGADEDQGLLLAAALEVSSQRVVVKRPRTSEAIQGPAPDFAVTGKQLRYDVYLTKE